MITIEYHDNYDFISSLECDEYHYYPEMLMANWELVNYIHSIVERYVKQGHTVVIVTTNEYVVTTIQLDLAREVIVPEDVRFVYNDETLEVNKYGVILHYPDDFTTVGIQLAEQTMDAAMARRSIEIKQRQAEARKRFDAKRKELGR